MRSVRPPGAGLPVEESHNERAHEPCKEAGDLTESGISLFEVYANEAIRPRICGGLAGSGGCTHRCIEMMTNLVVKHSTDNGILDKAEASCPPGTPSENCVNDEGDACGSARGGGHVMPGAIANAALAAVLSLYFRLGLR